PRVKTDNYSMNAVQKALVKVADPVYAKKVKYVFKDKYAPKDVFIGIKVPVIRSVIAEHATNLEKPVVQQLLEDPRHEVRLAGAISLVQIYQTTKPESVPKGWVAGGLLDNHQEDVIQFYLKNLKYINNWDIVDTSAYKLLGDWLKCTFLEEPSTKESRDKLLQVCQEAVSYKQLWNDEWDFKAMFPEWYVQLLESDDIWKIRVSIVMLLQIKSIKKYRDLPYFVCRWHIHRLAQEDFQMKLEGEVFEDHDLIHKALGWILREVGKESKTPLVDFLNKHHAVMPRTTISYATEKLDANTKARFTKKRKR
ncbi:hypothetical protein HDV05_000575, partial [Chytridiales sp. JEL 0842]